MIKSVCATLALTLLVPFAAMAQDLEYHTGELDTEADSKVHTNFSFESQWHEYNNLDFRTLDETSDQSILDSDDRNGFAFTGVSANLGYDIDDRTEFRIGMSHRGLWGGDQVGGTGSFGGWAYFSALYVDHRLGSSESAPRVRLGRQYFDIGGLGGGREYVLADTMDMARVDFTFDGVGHLTVIPIEILGLSGSNDDATLFQLIGQSSNDTFGFRGDHITRRHGFVFAANDLSIPLDARVYAFYTDIGANGTGSDISYNGLMGNFSDNDWVANFGARASMEFGPVTPFASFDMSHGIDRKELVTRDVNTNGMAIHAGLNVKTGDDEKGLRGGASFYWANGAAYAADGQQYSHGYVGMKAKHIGGQLTNRYLGWHPSSYVGLWGVSDEMHDINRKAGTQVINAEVGYDFGKVGVEAGWWMMADTGISHLEMDQIETIVPPYGYSRLEYYAQQRAGQSLGHEVNLHVDGELTEAITLELNGAVLLPGEYQKTTVDRIAGDFLGGDAMAWAVNGGARVKF